MLGVAGPASCCARFEFLEGELELCDLCIEPFGGATEAQALQPHQFDLELHRLSSSRAARSRSARCSSTSRFRLSMSSGR